MGVTLDVLEGQRPQIPTDCPSSFAEMLRRCWSADDDQRPAIEELLGFYSRYDLFQYYTCPSTLIALFLWLQLAG
jgi:hypothetical protein